MNRKLVTSQTVNVCKVFVGAQKKQILTVELVDEMDRPIAGICYTIAHKDGVMARGKFYLCYLYGNTNFDLVGFDKFIAGKIFLIR